MQNQQLVKAAELAAEWRTTTSTITRLLQNNAFPNAFRVKSSWRIPRSDIDTYIKRQREGAIHADDATTH